ncbi:MAG: cupin domain-containing protein [Eubacteriales bacterium]|nr:cupin domain-containing protein [Eubacteriales bacterium]
MTQDVIKLTRSDEKTIEKLVMDENLHYMHVIMPPGDKLPEHATNAAVYMMILRGTISISLNDEPTRDHGAGTLLTIPFQTKMNIANNASEALEITIVKAPPPQL